MTSRATFLVGPRASACWLLALIISWALCAPASAADKPQLSLGDKVSIYSDKAYRKGTSYFEAVGNVVIISKTDTVYGELASLDQESMMVKIEGNVRVITKDMTLYGSHVEYNIATGAAVISNARILTPDFNLVASRLVRISEEEYLAEEAEFSTCKDCAESWSVFGQTIRMRVGKYVQIRHGLAKIKGINVLYMPYLVLPILTKRKSGLLFPNISTRIGEGLAFEQPVFWAIDEHKDATFGPTFWARRGYGGDLQYRQRMKDMSWIELNSRALNDTIYEPGKSGLEPSGQEFFRYFVDAETHQQFNSNLSSHVRFTGVRDLDIIRDHPQFTDPRVTSSDFGLNADLNWRRDYFTISADAHYLRNQLFGDPLEFDRSYVQVLPRVSLSTVPYTLLQSQVPMFQNITLGMDSSFTRFRQVREDEGEFLRNADRISLQPYVFWHFFTWGPVSVRSRYTFDQQAYRFENNQQPSAGKNAGILKTEVSFTMDKVFGLAYEEKIPIQYISEAELQRLRERREQGLAPLRSAEREENRLVGELPPFESELSRDHIVQVRNSYRHSQEYKFIHHFLPSQNEYGNRGFLQQIRNRQEGLFDWEDAPRGQEYLIGGNISRAMMPPENTVEFQWNNSLIRKTPKTFSYLMDDKYLRDNFTYSQIGYFNVSQGYFTQPPTIGDRQSTDFRDQLTRLLVETGYNANRWSLSLQEIYYHSQLQLTDDGGVRRSSENIFNVNFTRRFDFLNLFGQYNYNSFNEANLNTVSFGGQLRPTDTLGFAMVKDIDIAAKREMRTVYALDIMPHNNCWILNLNYRESLVDSRYSFNIMFNFGDGNLERYRNNFFGANRL